MNTISIMDLKMLVRHTRFDIESAKRQLEKGGDERYMDMLRKKVETLEPVVERVESQLSDAKMFIKG